MYLYITCIDLHGHVKWFWNMLETVEYLNFVVKAKDIVNGLWYGIHVDLKFALNFKLQWQRCQNFKSADYLYYSRYSAC